MKTLPAPKPTLAILGKRDLELGPFAIDEAPQEASPWANWRLRTDENGIAWLLFDKKESSANTLSEDVLTELNAVLEKVERDHPRGLVIRSAKRSGFIAGADIAQFRGVTDPAPIEEALTRGHAVLDRLDRLPLPTVAVIHGYCLGGGLEVALACDFRIAIDDASFGFPEVLLGLHPGLGGTVRLTRLISPVQAMTMMLTGKTERARRARALHLVDAVTQERHVRAAVKSAVTGEIVAAKQSLLGRLMNMEPARGLLASRMRGQAAKKAPKRFYPAPYALIDLWAAHGGDRDAMQKAEVSSFAKLLVTETAQNLVRVFYLRESLKKLADGKWDGRRVHVIGAGAMGGDIAAWCAWHGFVVSLGDTKPEPIAGAIKRASALYAIIGRDSRRKVRDSLDRLIPDLKGDGVATADLIIEAVPEVLELKRKIFAGIEPKMKPDAILATNTSSIPLEQLREGLPRPERLVGIHFFNPVSRMQLVEVVSHDQVTAGVLADARAFLGRIDRLPAPVKSAPGFLVNRALTPYLLEALLMLDAGTPKETVDKAAMDFGMPMGPIELADEVGLDICLHVAEMLRGSINRDMPEPPQWLKDKVAKGELGKKTGKGLYTWQNGHAVKAKDDAAAPPADMIDRLILPMLDVCVTCLREGIVADERIVDGAMIFATGFAPFRGGPMHYARSRGIANVRDTLKSLAQKYGPRFQPDPGWELLAMIHSGAGPARFADPAPLADSIVAKVGKTIVLALPLGLGKANHIANALFAKAVADRSIRLTIFTALTLEAPRAKSELERRFLDPIAQRLFAGYPALDYAAAVHARNVPPNVEINEFFFEAGQWLGSPYAQQHYICANYTHALRYVLDRGVNVVAQLVAHRADEAPQAYSLSCNPDLTLDLLARRRDGGAEFLFAGQTNSELPFMPGDAAIGENEFDVLLDGAATDFPLFGAPREPVALADYAAGLHAASIVPDGGTLQIGIGSLGEAVAQALVLRQRDNDAFRTLLSRLGYDPARDAAVRAEKFDTGLYGCSELFVEGMLDLFRAGVLKREVDGIVLHAGFFLGSRGFYKALRDMPREVVQKFGMTSIAFVNELYRDQEAKRRARTNARFLNDAMMATALGDVVSDGLEDGRIVSGVGGQYNFIAQSFALDDARSAIMLRATRTARGRDRSNILWRYGHTTIPRHLRDMIITEYGVADVRGKSDREVIAAMLAIADSRFQDELLRQAKDAGKIEREFALPKSARDNTPDAIVRALKPAADAGLLPLFPFGTDFTAIERRLIPALQVLKSASLPQLAVLLMRGLGARAAADVDCLDRLGLARPKSVTEWFYAGLVRGALHAA